MNGYNDPNFQFPHLAGGDMFDTHGDCQSAERHARWVHSEFVNRYFGPEAKDAVPLLKLRLNQWDAPFVLALEPK